MPMPVGCKSELQDHSPHPVSLLQPSSFLAGGGVSYLVSRLKHILCLCHKDTPSSLPSATISLTMPTRSTASFSEFCDPLWPSLVVEDPREILTVLSLLPLLTPGNLLSMVSLVLFLSANQNILWAHSQQLEVLDMENWDN